MAVQSYVVVSNDAANLVIVGGPFLWDGVAPITLPASTHAILVSDAGAYTYPAPPVAQVNAATLQAKAQAALDANATYLAIASPSNAQVAAQVRKLTQECNALIRLTIGALDDTTGT